MEDKYIGQQFGCYKIIDISDKKANDGHKIYIGKCIECGCIREAIISYFKSRKPKHSSHRSSKPFWESKRLDMIFGKMIDRCYNTNSSGYRFYGGKGICICKEWLNSYKSFNDWAISNGYQDNLTIDRIDSNKNYCPENCRWITHSENSKFKSTTNYIEVNGILDSGKGWSRRLNLPINFINTYLRSYGIEETIKFINNCLLE